MERKYYLRGLGLGIAVTAVIMGIVTPGNRTMTSDEIIARAKELGLVENTVLLDTGNAADPIIDPDSEMVDTAVIENGDAADETERMNAPEVDNAGQEDADPENVSDEEPPGSGDVIEEKEQEDTTVPEMNNIGTENTNEVITSNTVRVITINSGDSSYTVAKKLADVGVVTSAENFDTFLCQYGYDKRLRTGTFSIPVDAGDEQIARIVTGLE